MILVRPCKVTIYMSNMKNLNNNSDDMLSININFTKLKLRYQRGEHNESKFQV